MAIIDSYSEDNQDADFCLYSGSFNYMGQAFTNTNASTLDSCKFYLKKQGSPPGNITAKLYAYDDLFTYGVNGRPIGSVLATSGNVVADGLTTDFQLITFDFTGAERITLTASTYYVIQVNYEGGNASNCLFVGIDESDASHSGNLSYSFNGTDWNSLSDRDACFYVYEETIVGITRKTVMLTTKGAMSVLRSIGRRGTVETIGKQSLLTNITKKTILKTKGKETIL